MPLENSGVGTKPRSVTQVYRAGSQVGMVGAPVAGNHPKARGSQGWWNQHPSALASPCPVLPCTHLIWRSGTVRGPSPGRSRRPGPPGPCSLGSLQAKGEGLRGRPFLPAGQESRGPSARPAALPGELVQRRCRGSSSLPTASCRMRSASAAERRSTSNCSSRSLCCSPCS